MEIREPQLRNDLNTLLQQNPQLMQVLNRNHIQRCMEDANVMKFYAAICTLIVDGKVVPPNLQCESPAVRKALDNPTFLLLIGSYLLYNHRVSNELAIAFIKKHLACAGFREAFSAAVHTWLSLMKIRSMG